MLTKKDLLLISSDYFVILKQTRFYLEVISKNTGHCWTIYKHGSPDKIQYGYIISINNWISATICTEEQEVLNLH